MFRLELTLKEANALRSFLVESSINLRKELADEENPVPEADRRKKATWLHNITSIIDKPDWIS